MKNIMLALTLAAVAVLSTSVITVYAATAENDMQETVTQQS